MRVETEEGTAPGRQMIAVDGAALRQILIALVGPPHLVRELQATRSLHALGHPNPIDIILADFNRQAQS